MELNGDKHHTTSIIDWEFIETQKRARAPLSGGYQYFRIRKELKDESFGDVVSRYV